MCQETAALRDFHPAYDRCGLISDRDGPTYATIHVRFAPKATAADGSETNQASHRRRDAGHGITPALWYALPALRETL
jgi:hypothetical protein